MTNLEINMAIAEALGVQYYRPTEEEFKSGSYYHSEPDYLNNLSLIISIAADFQDSHFCLSKPYKDKWCAEFHWNGNTLAKAWNDDPAMATCEAVLRKLRKWVEK